MENGKAALKNRTAKNRRAVFFSRSTRMLLFILLIASMLLLSGCGERKKEKALREEGIELLTSGDYQGASGKFDAALALYKKEKPGELEIDILRYRAEAEYKAQDYAAAGSTYSLLLSEDGEKPEYQDMKAMCLVKSGGSPADALSAYEKADELRKKKMSPLHQDVLFSLGDTLSAGSDEEKEQALTLYRTALDGRTTGTENDQIYAELTNRIGMIYYHQEKYEEALNCFSKGAADDPDGKELLFNEASCREHLQQYQEALDLFNSYISKFGEDEKAEHEILFLKSRLQNGG